MKDIEKAMQSASSCSEEELELLVHHTSVKVISKLLYNSNLTETLALVIANRKNITPDVLESLSNDGRWRKSYLVTLALCKNPKTPQKLSLSLLKSMRVFDLADLTRNRQVPINVRARAESYISEKILSMPLGIKITLARRASSNILMRLIEDGMKEVVTVCLDSPYMTEDILCKIINKKKTGYHVIRQIADHQKWSCRYHVLWSLIRNYYTPLSRVVNFLEKMKTGDLKGLYNDPGIPPGTRPFIYRELMDRG